MYIPEPRKLANGDYFIQLRLNGVSIPVSAPTKTECKAKAALIKSEYKNGKRRIAKSDITLKQVVDAYIESRRKTRSPATVRGYVMTMKHSFEDYMKLPAASIDLQKMIDDETEKDVSSKTIINAWGIVRPALKAAKIEVPDNLSLPTVVKHEHSFLEYEQIKPFMKAIEGKDFEISALLGLHSLRRSEIYGLGWDKIDLEKATISVHRALVLNEKGDYIVKNYGKTDTSRRVIPIMIPRLTELLKVAKEERQPVVSQALNSLYVMVNRSCRNAGLPEIGAHGLRHTFASLCFHLDVPAKICAQLGGWHDTRTVERIYTHISAGDRDEYVKSITDFYNNANKNANDQQSSQQNQAL